MLLRKLFRTAWKYKAQFISMIIMVAIGIGVFIGFNMEWRTLEKDVFGFLEQTNYADYRIYAERGFTANEVKAIEDIEGVTAATRILSVSTNLKDGDKSLELFVTENQTVSTMYVTEGIEYDDASDGFWLSDRFAAANGIKLGDTITLSYRSIELGGEVVGLIKCSEFTVCITAANQLMPDFDSYGFVCASPKKVARALAGFIIYPQINLLSTADKAYIEESVENILGSAVLVTGKSEHTTYAAGESEIEEGQTMGSVLPVLFLLIGILTMITTMHRITVNEKTQIGTLKALGFKNGKILRHYTAYGLFIGIVGTLLGCALGVCVCAVMLNPASAMRIYFDIPDWTMYAPWWVWLVAVGVVAFLTLISFLSVKKMLKGTAADALRPYAPKKVKPLAVEKTKLWDKLGFASRWNLRDVFRHKTRTLMTLIGIVGCMLLLVGGLGLCDTMNNYLDTLDSKILNYETRVNFAETVTDEQAAAFVAKYGGDCLSSQTVKLDGEPTALEIYSVENDMLRFTDIGGKTVKLDDGGAYVCKRLYDKGIRAGDTVTVTPYGSDESYEIQIIGVIRSFQTESVVMTEDYAKSAGIRYSITAALVNVPPSEISSESYIAGMQTKSAVMQSYDSFMEVMNLMVVMIVLAAVILGVVVLYNLGVMSYVERYRELATLKVVGFKNKHIARILVSQNIWLSLIGIVIGLPLGVGVLQLLLTLLGSEYELGLSLGALTFCVSVLVTFGVSLVVSIAIARKNRRINMTEALKCSE